MAKKPSRPKCRKCHNIEAEVMVFDRRLDFNTGQMKERKLYRCPQCQAYLGPCYERKNRERAAAGMIFRDGRLVKREDWEEPQIPVFHSLPYL